MHNEEDIILISGGEYGSYDGAYHWSLNFDKLSENYHVLAFDKFGMGFTDHPKRDEDYTIMAALKHAHDFIIDKGVKKVNLVGHSRGGFLAAKLALDYPDLVNKLVIVDSRTLAPDDPSVPMDFYERLENNAPPGEETRESVIRETVANSYSTNHITDDFVNEKLKISRRPQTVRCRKELKMGVGYEGPSPFMLELNARRKETIQMIKSGKLNTPSLIVWGNNDPSAPVKLAWDLFNIFSAVISRTQLHILSQSGHYSFRERPDEFNKIVSAFIDYG